MRHTLAAIDVSVPSIKHLYIPTKRPIHVYLLYEPERLRTLQSTCTSGN